MFQVQVLFCHWCRGSAGDGLCGYENEARNKRDGYASWNVLEAVAMILLPSDYKLPEAREPLSSQAFKDLLRPFFAISLVILGVLALVNAWCPRRTVTDQRYQWGLQFLASLALGSISNMGEACEALAEALLGRREQLREEEQPSVEQRAQKKPSHDNMASANGFCVATKPVLPF